VIKVERTTPATYTGVRISDNIQADRRWNGDVAEIITFDSKLSGDDTLRVQNYLSAKYNIPFATALDERITESKQMAVDPFGDGSQRAVAVNFHYGGPTAGSFAGLGINNVDLAGGAPAGPIALTDHLGLPGATLTLAMPFTSDNSPRSQNAAVTGPDSATLNTVLNEFFYLGGNNHPTAGMLFAGLAPHEDVFVQVLGGDSGWTGDILVTANGTQAVDWLGVADGGSSASASLLGFYTKADGDGELDLTFTIPGDSHAGIAGVVLIQQVPEPASLALSALALSGLGAYLRRRRT